VKFKGGREKNEEKTVVDAKPDSRYRHTLFHYVRGVKTFQTLNWKAMFGGRKTPHMPLKCAGAFHTLARATHAPTSFFKLYSIHIVYSNAPGCT